MESANGQDSRAFYLAYSGEFCGKVIQNGLPDQNVNENDSGSHF